MKSWMNNEYLILNTPGYLKIRQYLIKCSIQPKYNQLDNRCSPVYKQALEKAKVTSQLLPPIKNQINKTERAIQTFKNISSQGYAL